MSDLPQEVQDALETMTTNIRTIGGLLKKQINANADLVKRIEALEAESNGGKVRKVTGDPEAIAIALHLIHKKGYSIQAVKDSGVLSYSKAYGVYSWPEEHRNKWLEEHGMVDVYEDPIANSPKASKIYALAE